MGPEERKQAGDSAACMQIKSEMNLGGNRFFAKRRGKSKESAPELD